LMTMLTTLLMMNEIRILRVCNQFIDQSIDANDISGSQLFRALYEVELRCGSSPTFADADYLYPGNDTLVLTVQTNLAIGGGTSRVCTYSISDINTAMDDSLSDCASGIDRRTIWDGHFPPNVQNFVEFLQ